MTVWYDFVIPLLNAKATLKFYGLCFSATQYVRIALIATITTNKLTVKKLESPDFITTNTAFGNTNHSPIATKSNTVSCPADLCMTKTTKRLSNMAHTTLMTPTVFILEYQNYVEFIVKEEQILPQIFISDMK